MLTAPFPFGDGIMHSGTSGPIHIERLAVRAMATRFELMLCGSDPAHLRAAGEEALREIQRIESACNFYSASSELSRINREAGQSAVRISGAMLRLLEACAGWSAESNGLFDPSVAPALARWGLRNRNDVGRIPTADELSSLQPAIGFDRIELDRQASTIRFPHPDMKLDLGGVAKGWALDEARLLLEESGVTQALLHGGTSTAIGMGRHPDGSPWRIGLEDPYHDPDNARNEVSWFASMGLENEAFSVSGVHGKSFEALGLPSVTSGHARNAGNTTTFGHVIHPATAQAISGPRVSLVRDASAARADAWSTALLADPETDPPDSVRGTTFLKTDSGWTVTAGRPADVHLL